MKVWSDEIYGLRLVEKPGVYVVDEVWNKRNEHIGRWESFPIPDQHEIIGIECGTDHSERYISRLGFRLWRPNPAAKS